MDKNDLNVMFSHKSDSWTTPQWLFDKLNQQYNFTLDPASDDQNHKCIKYYTIDNDGLKQDWKGETVFINPPYSKVYDWVKKAHTEAKENNTTCVMLIPARTCTRFWHDFIMDNQVCSKIIFIRGRLKFGNSKNCAPFPSVLIEFKKSDDLNRQIIIDNISNKKS